jgi:hypothetical protein
MSEDPHRHHSFSSNCAVLMKAAVNCGSIRLPIEPKMFSKFKLGHSKMIFVVENIFRAPLGAPQSFLVHKCDILEN